MGLPARIVRSRDEATVRMELLRGGKTVDVIDLEQQGVRHHSPGCRAPTRVAAPRGSQARCSCSSFSSRRTWRLEQLPLRRVEGRHWEPRELGELLGGGHVVLLHERPNAALASDRPTDQEQPSAKEIAHLPMGIADHVRLRNELHAQQLRQGLGIDRASVFTFA